MRKLTTEKRTAILSVLVEGMSIRATARVCGVSKLTILRLLADVGSLCRDYHDLVIRGLASRRIQCDEIWSFVGCKQKNLEKGKQGHGDAWTWVAMDADTKLVIGYLVGGRGAGYAREFMLDVAGRINTRVQLTTDGHGVYLDAVENAFGFDVDYAMLVKLYGPEGGETTAERKYSPGQCTGARKLAQIAIPDRKHITTSFVATRHSKRLWPSPLA